MRGGVNRKLLATGLALLAFHTLFFHFNPANPPVPIPPLFGTVGFLAFIAVAHIVLFVAFRKQARKRNINWALVAAAISLIFALASLFRASMVDRSLLSLVSLWYLTGVYYLLALTTEKFGSALEIVILPFSVVVGWILGAPAASRGTRLSGNRMSLSTKKDVVGVFVRGLIITVPVLVMVAVLLGDADPIFGRILQDIFRIELPDFPVWVIVRLLLSVFFLLALIPLLYARIPQLTRRKSPDKEYPGTGGELTMLVGALALLLLVFLIVQFRYLFADVAETELIKYGVQTYSEYVRRGFLELIAVSVIIYLASLTALTYFIRNQKARLLRNVNTLLLIEAGVFVLSVFRRVYLYVVEHGLTRSRAYGSAFLVVMLTLTIILILRYYARGRVQWYIVELAAVSLIIFVTCTANVDSIIANHFPPTVNNEVDYVHIARLSPDAVDGWLEAYDHAVNEIGLLEAGGIETDDDKRRLVYAYLAINSFYRNYGNLAYMYGSTQEISAISTSREAISTDFRYGNLSGAGAYLALKKHIDTEELQGMYERASRHYRDLDTIPALDRSMNSPLL